MHAPAHVGMVICYLEGLQWVECKSTDLVWLSFEGTGIHIMGWDPCFSVVTDFGCNGVLHYRTCSVHENVVLFRLAVPQVMKWDS